MIDLMTTEKQFLRPDEVMEIVGISRRTLYYWIEHRRLSAVKIGGTIRIPVEDLRKRLRIRRSKPAIAQALHLSAKVG